MLPEICTCGKSNLLNAISSSYNDTGPTRPSTDPVVPGYYYWQTSHSEYQSLGHWYDSTRETTTWYVQHSLPQSTTVHYLVCTTQPPIGYHCTLPGMYNTASHRVPLYTTWYVQHSLPQSTTVHYLVCTTQPPKGYHHLICTKPPIGYYYLICTTQPPIGYHCTLPGTYNTASHRVSLYTTWYVQHSLPKGTTVHYLICTAQPPKGYHCTLPGMYSTA